MELAGHERLILADIGLLVWMFITYQTVLGAER